MTLSLPIDASGVHLPALGLGCMGMSAFYGKHDDDASLAVLHRAYELGIRMFDTADIYGDNEILLARFLKEKGDDVFTATKFGIRIMPEGDGRRCIDNSPDYIRKACESSLQRLGRERIDLYYIHRVQGEAPIEEAMGVLADLVREGKIARIGLSEASAATLRRAHAVHPVSALQSEYSLVTRDMEAEILPACQELGVAFVAYSPLGRGLLSGALNIASLASDDFRHRMPRFEKQAYENNLSRLETLRSVASAYDVSPAQMSLAWVLSKGVFAIPGTTRLLHLEANVQASHIVISDEDLKTLDNAYAPGIFSGERYNQEGMKHVNM